MVRNRTLLIIVARQRQSQLSQLVLNLFQTLSAEVTDLDHLVLRLVDQILNSVDVCSLQAVKAAHREIQLLNRHVKQLVFRGFHLFDNGACATNCFGAVCENCKVIDQNL